MIWKKNKTYSFHLLVFVGCILFIVNLQALNYSSEQLLHELPEKTFNLNIRQKTISFELVAALDFCFSKSPADIKIALDPLVKII